MATTKKAAPKDKARVDYITQAKTVELKLGSKSITVTAQDYADMLISGVGPSACKNIGKKLDTLFKDSGIPKPGNLVPLVVNVPVTGGTSSQKMAVAKAAVIVALKAAKIPGSIKAQGDYYGKLTDF